ncbi:MAG: DegV family protein [Lachnospiraceae bacterium]|nr:DegV family protein [Lachnospiraceae bacterium]
MSKVAIVTDSNSGITQNQAKKMGVYVLPMPFYINDELYLEDITLTQEKFYEMLADGADVRTSQPSIGEVKDMWNLALKDNDELVYIPMSSGLSSSCQTATMLAEDYDGKVFVVDNQRISVTQKQSVLDALYLATSGKTGAEIKEILLRDKMESSIYITVDTLSYLKKGGRVTAAGAAIGSVLNLKPVLTIQGEKLDAFAKVRGMKVAKKTMLDAIEKDLKERFDGKPMHLEMAYTYDDDEAKIWADEIMNRFPNMNKVDLDPLSLSVSCHIGPGALAVAVSIVEEQL